MYVLRLNLLKHKKCIKWFGLDGPGDEYVLSRVLVTIDGVWIGEWIY
jgi:hypothetical protein